MPDVPLPRSRFIEGRTGIEQQRSKLIRGPNPILLLLPLFAADLQHPTNHSTGIVSSRHVPLERMTAKKLIRRYFPRFHVTRNHPCNRSGSATVTGFGRALIAFGDLQPT